MVSENAMKVNLQVVTVLIDVFIPSNRVTKQTMSRADCSN